MKVGFNGLKGKEISLISIVLMSATIILWSWEKTPGLSTFLPPHTPPIQLSGLLPFIRLFSLKNTDIISFQYGKYFLHIFFS